MPFYGIITDKGMRTFSRALNAEVPEKYWIAIGATAVESKSQPSSTTNDIEGEILREEATATSSTSTITFSLTYTAPTALRATNWNMIGIFDRSSGGDLLYMGYYEAGVVTTWPMTPQNQTFGADEWTIAVGVTVGNE